MNDHELEQLLSDADIAAPPSPRQRDLADRIQRSYRNQRQRRAVTAATLVLLFATSLVVLSMNRSEPPLAVRAPAPTAQQDDLAMLETRIRLHTLTAERLIATKPRKSQPAKSTLADFEMERDRAALILIYDAERYLECDRIEDAIAAYRRTIELFPQSHWAQVAEQRLKEMQT